MKFTTHAQKFILTAIVLVGGIALGFNACSMGDAYSTGTSGLSSAGGMISISPATISLTPGQQVTFQSTGGVGNGYVYSLFGGNGTLTASGVFTAPNIYETDTVQVVDSNGNEAFATVIVGSTSTLGSATGLRITPNNFSITVNRSATLVASGGTAPYTFAIYSALGSVTSAGVYTAPASPGTDYIMVTDASNNTAYASISITN